MDRKELEKLKLAQLKEIAKIGELKISGLKKDEIIDLIIEKDNESKQEAPKKTRKKKEEVKKEELKQEIINEDDSIDDNNIKNSEILPLKKKMKKIRQMLVNQYLVF